MESRQNLARLGMFYGNKSPSPLSAFTPNVTCPGSLASCLNVQVKPVDPSIDAGAQVQQLINIECLSDFYSCPTMQLHFIQNGAPKNVLLQLPLFLNKFIEPTEMNSEQFFGRWKQLSL